MSTPTMPTGSADMPEPVRLEVAGLGTVSATGHADPRTGTLTYTVTSSRVAGAFVLIPVFTPGPSEARPLDPDRPRLRVAFGPDIPDPGAEPVRINGIALACTTTLEVEAVLSGAFADRPHDHYFQPARCHVPGNRYGVDVPRATAHTAAAIVAALVSVWRERPDRPALCRVAARAVAGEHIAHHEECIRQLRTQQEQLAARIAGHRAHLDAARAAGHPAHRPVGGRVMTGTGPIPPGRPGGIETGTPRAAARDAFIEAVTGHPAAALWATLAHHGATVDTLAWLLDRVVFHAAAQAAGERARIARAVREAARRYTRRHATLREVADRIAAGGYAADPSSIRAVRADDGGAPPGP